MNRKPITHLIMDTSSSNEFDNGGCDYCLVPMTVEYIAFLLDSMDEVLRMHRADSAVYLLECWDSSPGYVRDNDKLGALRHVDGAAAADVPRGEPILLTADPQFNGDDFQRVECQSVQVLGAGVRWIAYVKHTDIRIESAHVGEKTLRRVFQSLGGTRERHDGRTVQPVPPGIQGIHDLLYLDIVNDRDAYNPDKSRDPEILDRIAEVIAEFIPRPPRIDS